MWKEWCMRELCTAIVYEFKYVQFILLLLLIYFLIFSDWVRSVAFSDDNKWVASGSNDNSVRLWCMEDSSKNQVLQGHTGMFVCTYVVYVFLVNVVVLHPSHCDLLCCRSLRFLTLFKYKHSSHNHNKKRMNGISNQQN